MRASRELFLKLLDRSMSVDGPLQHSPCLIWAGSADTRGYGRFGSKRLFGQTLSHRIVYELFSGVVLTSDQCVCHKCDNPRCVRYDHLFVGSYADNNRDRDLKNRTARGLSNGAFTHPHRRPRGDRNGMKKNPGVMSGVKNPNSKGNNEYVMAICRQYKELRSYGEVARRNGLSTSCVRNWVLGIRRADAAACREGK